MAEPLTKRLEPNVDIALTRILMTLHRLLQARL
jgi:hypothetical protein